MSSPSRRRIGAPNALPSGASSHGGAPEATDRLPSRTRVRRGMPGSGARQASLARRSGPPGCQLLHSKATSAFHATCTLHRADRLVIRRSHVRFLPPQPVLQTRPLSPATRSRPWPGARAPASRASAPSAPHGPHHYMAAGRLWSDASCRGDPSGLPMRTPECCPVCSQGRRPAAGNALQKVVLEAHAWRASSCRLLGASSFGGSKGRHGARPTDKPVPLPRSPRPANLSPAGCARRPSATPRGSTRCPPARR